ncbi:hypothetical protein H257_06022 [Aphanomyces astaci]|uniref:Uncharacterized protein n=1 Tax=Aphanomyces astaci TaxID=112090 RepID=W4GP79_APHAT|nr:hypothetical protein H257_06022 [Aphanomyces astaci]ETV81530.1 hypothetical protein H257_06022 [Aphanomyces astaci]|eukprot:XP_009829388.1 hypothetical protein H257_06022 [Aphanomyces astaci]
MARYAVDVTFQQTNAPAVSFGEKKVFFSKKHGQYGVKQYLEVCPTLPSVISTPTSTWSTCRRREMMAKRFMPDH